MHVKELRKLHHQCAIDATQPEIPPRLQVYNQQNGSLKREALDKANYLYTLIPRRHGKVGTKPKKKGKPKREKETPAEVPIADDFFLTQKEGKPGLYIGSVETPRKRPPNMWDFDEQKGVITTTENTAQMQKLYPSMVDRDRVSQSAGSLQRAKIEKFNQRYYKPSRIAGDRQEPSELKENRISKQKQRDPRRTKDQSEVDINDSSWRIDHENDGEVSLHPLLQTSESKPVSLRDQIRNEKSNPSSPSKSPTKLAPMESSSETDASASPVKSLLSGFTQDNTDSMNKDLVKPKKKWKRVKRRKKDHNEPEEETTVTDDNGHRKKIVRKVRMLRKVNGQYVDASQYDEEMTKSSSEERRVIKTRTVLKRYRVPSSSTRDDDNEEGGSSGKLQDILDLKAISGGIGGNQEQLEHSGGDSSSEATSPRREGGGSSSYDSRDELDGGESPGSQKRSSRRNESKDKVQSSRDGAEEKRKTEERERNRSPRSKNETQDGEEGTEARNAEESQNSGSPDSKAKAKSPRSGQSGVEDDERRKLEQDKTNETLSKDKTKASQDSEDDEDDEARKSKKHGNGSPDSKNKTKTSQDGEDDTEDAEARKSKKDGNGSPNSKNKTKTSQDSEDDEDDEARKSTKDGNGSLDSENKTKSSQDVTDGSTQDNDTKTELTVSQTATPDDKHHQNANASLHATKVNAASNTEAETLPNPQKPDESSGDTKSNLNEDSKQSSQVDTWASDNIHGRRSNRHRRWDDDYYDEDEIFHSNRYSSKRRRRYGTPNSVRSQIPGRYDCDDVGSGRRRWRSPLDDDFHLAPLARPTAATVRCAIGAKQGRKIPFTSLYRNKEEVKRMFLESPAHYEDSRPVSLLASEQNVLCQVIDEQKDENPLVAISGMLAMGGVNKGLRSTNQNTARESARTRATHSGGSALVRSDSSKVHNDDVRFI